MDKYKEALEGMVWQFAYRGVKDNKPILWTGCQSALEHAFRVLDYPDPKFIDDIDGSICDVEGCPEWVETQGTNWGNEGYWCLCANHSHSKDTFPKMKQRAIDRENSRDPITKWLSMK